MITCVGVTEKGHKKVLGFTQATNEHSGPIKELFRDLIERGLCFEDGLLCVVDGGKGLRKAIDDIFGRNAQVQRCQWHKRETVVSYLPKADQPKWRKKLQRAYQEPSYESAKERLRGLRARLEQINRRAARSLMEGLEETLTLHQLGLFEELGRSLKTTNCIENLNSQVEKHIGKVKRWHHSQQRHQGPILLVWDRARWHTSKAVEEMLAQHERIETVLLPKRSPEKGPVEDLWRQPGNTVAANLERDLEALKEACRRFFDELAPEDALKIAGLS